MTEFPAHPAWDFVVRLYGAPGVAPACLELQERHDVDVTLMLFCLWLGAECGKPVAARLPALLQVSERWRRGAILPIRVARTWLKGEGADVAALRQTVSRAEIDCEHGELLALARLAEGAAGGESLSSATEALASFLAASDVRLGEADRAAIATLVAAIGRSRTGPAA